MAITVSYPVGDDLVNETLPLRLCHPVILQMAFPEVEEQSERSHPHLILRKMKVGDAEIKKPGKKLPVGYSASGFFGSVSLSTFRFIPFIIASVIASLYEARSEGTVRSSTSSSVRRGLGLSLFLRLWIIML